LLDRTHRFLLDKKKHANSLLCFRIAEKFGGAGAGFVILGIMNGFAWVSTHQLYAVSTSHFHIPFHQYDFFGFHKFELLGAVSAFFLSNLV